MERKISGESEVFHVKSPKTKDPRNWKALMCNKEQLIHLLTEWPTDKYAHKLVGRKVLFVFKEECDCIHSVDGASLIFSQQKDPYSSQEQVDTRIMLDLIKRKKRRKVLVVPSPDTDVMVLC